MGGLVGVLRQRLVVEAARRVGIEREVELILPPEFEPGAADRVIAQLGGGMTIASRPGFGTRIDVWLPLSVDQVRAIEGARSSLDCDSG